MTARDQYRLTGENIAAAGTPDGNDTIFGGDDELDGGDGGDRLRGDETLGHDMLIGGPGMDRVNVP